MTRRTSKNAISRTARPPNMMTSVVPQAPSGSVFLLNAIIGVTSGMLSN